jgi:hypothetical protein
MCSLADPKLLVCYLRILANLAQKSARIASLKTVAITTFEGLLLFLKVSSLEVLATSFFSLVLAGAAGRSKKLLPKPPNLKLSFF